MPKEEWGVKRVCPTTGKRFYDMGRNPIVSPYTGEVVVIDEGNKSRAALKGDKPDKKKEEEAVEEDADLDVLDDDDDSDVDLGDDVLEDDDDDNVSLDEIADVASDKDDS
ncbi:TIGR02300 family protein [Vannielia sp.]|uniref:TIGR02300 family protein n=1 Tax=Vannielia sp. TaxID=2813045 RepID=UPI0026077301|nr:TIGR02300 family protein [Vannielia sp.]MDF1874069.1 TIGR02300 family protein [Vannielia sp.]